jgi:hypothetical protein
MLEIEVNSNSNSNSNDNNVFDQDRYNKLLLESIELQGTNIDLFNALNDTLQTQETFIEKKRNEYNKILEQYIEKNDILKNLDEEKNKSLYDLLNKKTLINEDKNLKTLKHKYETQMKYLNVKLSQYFIQNEKMKQLLDISNDKNDKNSSDKNSDKNGSDKNSDKNDKNKLIINKDPYPLVSSLLNIGFAYGFMGFTVATMISPILVVYGITKLGVKFLRNR